LFSGRRDSDTLVISYYPVGGNDANTGPRYREEARLTGFDILGITRPGTNTLLPSHSMRRQLAPAHFDRFVERHLGVLARIANDYEYVIMRGQPSGAFPTLAVVKSEQVRTTHLLIEDGINIRRRSDGTPRGPVAARWDWFQHTWTERRRMPRPPITGWQLPPEASVKSGKVLRFFVEQFHWAPLWRSSYTTDALISVAHEQPALPMLVKFLGHSPTITRADLATFRARIAEAMDKRRVQGSPTGEICVEYDADAWHGYLLYPQYGAANLVQVREMQHAST
jgi:hypothetical protein